MAAYNGEDLLNIFKDLNVETGNLSPNVIKAWFDTDCKDMKNLLNWMCNSLSKENYLSAQQILEYAELESPLVGQKYEKELNNIERQYPTLFETELNTFDIQLAEDEIDLLVQDEGHADKLIEIHENLQKSLLKELAQITSEDIKSTLKCETAQDECETQAEKLDEINEKLYNQIVNYGSKLHDFEYGAFPVFLNNMDIKEYQQSFDKVLINLSAVLREFEIDENGESLRDVTGTNDELLNSLTKIRNRIYHSRKNYLINKRNEEKFNVILNYLNHCTVDSVLSLVESVHLQLNIEIKTEQMSAMIEPASGKFADYNICQPKLRHAQKELEIYESKLNRLNHASDKILKLLSSYSVISILYKQEKLPIDSSNIFLRNIFNYITKDLGSSAVRSNHMKSIIEDYEKDKAEIKDSEKYKLINSIAALLKNESGGKNFSLNEALEIVNEFKTDMKCVKKRLMSHDCTENTKEILNNIKNLRKFLVSGPTHRIILVCPQLQNAFQEIDELLTKQNNAVKSAMEITLKKKSYNKWQLFRRQLWMHFLTNREKMFSILQQVEECKKQQKCAIKK